MFMKRQLLLTLLSAAMLTSMAQVNGFSGGNGSSSSPYQIATASALQTLSKNVSSGTTYDNVYFVLTSDIDLSAIRSDFGWQPIGVYNGTGFAGTFDGAGHTVSGMYIKSPADGLGLFGYLSGGTVKDVILDGSDVTANNYVGGIVGYNNGTIIKCIVRNSKILVTGGFGNGGAIAGSIYHGNVADCKVYGSAISAQHSNIGGIAGSVYNAKITGCTVASTAFSGGTHRGAIAGINEGGSLMLKDNIYGGDVTGIMGALDGIDVQNGGAMKGYVPKDPNEPAKVLAATSATSTAVPTVTRPEAPASLDAKGGKATNNNKEKTKKKRKLGRSSGSEATPAEPAAASPSVPEADNPVSVPPTEPVPVKATVVSATSQPQVVTSVEAAAPKIAPSLSSEKYIVKTKGVKKPVATVKTERPKNSTEQPEATDFMGKNFRFYSMCDWTEGMRFMVVPEKYDLLVNTFRDAKRGKEVSSGILRHKIMVYKGHTDLDNGRVHINFHCEDNNEDYYYELPSGTFEDYCWGKLGVPTLAYLGDVDKARELLLNKMLLTRTQFFRVDTEYDGDGFKEVTVDKDKPVTVKAVGVGTRAFPVKIIVEDENGNQFYQCVAMSKTNSGLRDDEFTLDNEKFQFHGSFDLGEGEMAVSENVKDYLNKHVYTKEITPMSSKGSGKVRDVKVPRFTGFIIDEIEPIQGSPFYTLTLRETESRRIYHMEVVFHEEDIHDGSRDALFGHIFGMGDGIAHTTSKETRAAIREGRVIIGMTHDEVEMAMGEPISKVSDDKGIEKWLYPRSNNVILEVYFDEKGRVNKGKTIKGNTASPSTNAMQKKNMRSSKPSSSDTKHGTPLR